jgi:hypothetical protein
VNYPKPEVREGMKVNLLGTSRSLAESSPSLKRQPCACHKTEACLEVKRVLEATLVNRERIKDSTEVKSSNRTHSIKD